MGAGFSVVVATEDGLRALGEAPAGDLESRDVIDVKPDAHGLVALDHSTVLSGGLGRQWRLLAQRPVGGLTCLLPTRGALIVGSEGAHIFEVRDGELQRIEAFDRVPGRDHWHTPWGAPPAVRSLTEAPDGALLVNVHVGGIVRSDDGGRTWRETIDIGRDVHQVAVVPESGQVLAACGVGGLAVSDDAGATWTFESRGLHGDYCRAVAVTDRAVLVSASTGPFSDWGAVYRRALDGGAFERVDGDLPDRMGGNIDTGWIASDGGRAAIALRDGSVHASDDAGASWRRLGQTPTPRAVMIARAAG